MTRAAQGPTVKPGQIWADNDPRMKGRTIRVDQIISKLPTSSSDLKLQARCTVLTKVGGDPVDRPRTVDIAVDRFRPISTGYVLVQDPIDEPDPVAVLMRSAVIDPQDPAARQRLAQRLRQEGIGELSARAVEKIVYEWISTEAAR